MYRSELWQDKIAKIYVENLVKSERIAQAFNVHFIAFFQPALFFKNELSSEEEKLIDQDRKDNSLSIHRKLLDQINALEDGRKINFIDLSGVYDRVQDTVYVDRVHTHQEYKSLIVEKMYLSILEYLRKEQEVNSSPICGTMG